MAPAHPMLELTHIGKAFSGVSVLEDVHFELRPGEIHVLAGENGAGKSTLIKIIAGVYADYQGAVLLDGREARFRSPQAALAQGIAVIHQELSLVPSLSVQDNLFLGREQTCGGFVKRRTETRQAYEILRQMDLDLDIHRPVGEYPLAVQQLIEIARALAGRVRILIMDEPTSALTAVETERLFNLMRGLKERGCGLVYITHRMEEIYRLADRITVLRDGRWIGTAPADELPREMLIRWMVGRTLTEQFPARAAQPGAERLALRNFGVMAGGRRCVTDVNLAVRAGEIVGLAGLQGSGNSELLLGLFGAYGRRTSGEVQVDGRTLMPASPRAALRAGLALLTKDRKETGLVLNLGVAANIAMASLARISPWGWMSRRVEAERADHHREALGIRCVSLEQPAGTLSGGNQQKVALAKWLETQPAVLLLDEPTRGVDIGAKHEIYELMNQWTRAGLAILLITSEMPELLALCDRIMVMHRGKITAGFDRASACQERILAAAMGEVVAA